jgi:RNA-dependent RNA polymerase
VPVPHNSCPHLLIPFKPDWHAAEVAAPRDVDYYESTRALGHLYRAIELREPPAGTGPGSERLVDLNSDAITACLRQAVEACILKEDARVRCESHVEKLFDAYQEELGYICTTHVVTNNPGVCLVEEEIVTGTISAK